MKIYAKEASAYTGFADNRLVRHDELRHDEQLMEVLRQDDRAKFILFLGDRPLVQIGKDSLSVRHGHDVLQKTPIKANSLIFLGKDEEQPLFAGLIDCEDGEMLENETFKFIDLRSLAVQDALREGELGVLAQARGVHYWHGQSRHCGRCGGLLKPEKAGYQLGCEDCSSVFFPRTDPVAIMLAVRENRCLLGRQSRFPPGSYSCLAGFIEPGETLEAAVRRETLEESGIKIGEVRYFASQPWPFPGSLMIGCHGHAYSETIKMDETELEDCRWFTRQEVMEMRAGTHTDGLVIPPKMAIAHHIISAFVDEKITFEI